MNSIDVDLRDVVIYDGEGYPALRGFLKNQGIRHVLLAGYNTDMCVCSTTAGYKNLAQDFDVFLVGDATIATFPAQPTPRFATTSSVCFAALNLFITQASWVRPVSVAPIIDERRAGRCIRSRFIRRRVEGSWPRPWSTGLATAGIAQRLRVSVRPPTRL